MENNLVRTEDLFGSKKNIIGSNTSDLILETLGKIYVKTGNKTRVLNDVFKLLDNLNKDNSGTKTIITTALERLKYPGDGYLVFDTSKNALYISYDLRYLLVIDSIDKEVKDVEYVKKIGDTMTGPLHIKHKGAPLIVASNELVKNFNANYLEGHRSSYFAAKELDELIYGKWSFENDIIFKKNVEIKENLNVGINTNIDGELRVQNSTTLNGTLYVDKNAEFNDNAIVRKNAFIKGDIILNGSIGSLEFMDGYNGYGWRFEANTNMLTVDYLVVRKAMHVFELVVNKISATNGSLWVTDSSKIEEVYDIYAVPSSVTLTELSPDLWYVLEENKSVIEIPNLYLKRAEEPISNTSSEFEIYKHIQQYRDKSELTEIDENHESIPDETLQDKFNFKNVSKFGILFSECYIPLNATHFERQKGFRTPLEYEQAVYVHMYEPQYREALLYTAATHVYDSTLNSNQGGFRIPVEGEVANYVEKTLPMYVPATSNATHKYNTVTKQYELSDTDASYIYDANYKIYVLAGGTGETAEYVKKGDHYILYKTTHNLRYSYKPKYVQFGVDANDIKYVADYEKVEYVQHNNTYIKATHVKLGESYRQAISGEIATHLPVEKPDLSIDYIKAEYAKKSPIYVYTLNGFKLAEENETATHYYDYGSETYIEVHEDGQVYVKATHGITLEYTSISNKPKTHVLNIVTDDDGNILTQEYLPADAYTEPTHVLETYYTTTQPILEYIFLGYRELSRGEIGTHGIEEEFYESDAVDENGNVIASHLLDPTTDTYVTLEELGTPTHVLSNYVLSNGIVNATHVYVPNNYIAPASNLDLPTHIQVGSETMDYNEYIMSNHTNAVEDNKIFNINTTPKIITVDRALKHVSNSDLRTLSSFYRYFGVNRNDSIWNSSASNLKTLPNVKVIKMSDDEYPPFKEGDIVRCLKFADNTIKYYDGLIASKLDQYTYIIIVAGSVFDKQTTVKYNEDGTVGTYLEELNTNLYNKTYTAFEEPDPDSVQSEKSLVTGPAPKDGLVRIGHLFDRDRQNSVYITSSEMGSPYIQTISGINRPDYSVLYAEPDFITNNRGLYEFSADDLLLTDSRVRVITPNGPQYFLVTEIEGDSGTTKRVFYAPNNNYIAIKNDGSEFSIIANYNPNKVKQNTNVRTRLGNLNGITDSMFGDKLPYGYGLFADNVFLKGEFYLNNGKTVVEFSKEQAAIESEKIALKAVSKKDNLFYASDGDDYSELINDNLLSNTNFDCVENPTKHWTISSDGGIVVTNGFDKYNSFKSNVGKSDVAKINIPITLKAGETYTLSMLAKNTHTSGAATGILFGIPGKEISGSLQRLWTSVYTNGISIGTLFSDRSDIYFNSTPNWLKKILVFRMNDDAPDISGSFITFYQWGSDSTNGNYGEWALLKLERGDTATKYCKALSDYKEGNPDTYKEDFGRWCPINGQIQKSERISSDGSNYIKGIGNELGLLNLITVSKKGVLLTKGLKIYVLMDFFRNYPNVLLSLYGIKNGKTISMGSCSVTLGVYNYTFSADSVTDVDTDDKIYFLMLELGNIPELKVDVVEFKTEIASENRIGVDATITMENGRITLTIRDEFTEALNETVTDIEGTITNIQSENSEQFATYSSRLDEAESTIEDINTGLSTVTQTVEGFEQRVESVEGDVSLVKQTSNEWSTLVGYSYVLFETPKLSIAKHNEWASIGGVDTWQAEASNYIKLFNKTETYEVYNALGSGVIEWRNGDSYIKAKSELLILYFKPPYEIKKDTEIVIKLTTQDNFILQYGFSISGVIRNSSETALSNTVSHTLLKDELSFELKLKLSEDIQDQQIYNLYITSPSIPLFYLKYPISTNLDIFEGSQILVFQDNIKISTKELTLTNDKGSTKLLSEDRDMEYNVSGEINTSIELASGYTLDTSLDQITISYLTPTHNSIEKYPFWTYYPIAKEITDYNGVKYERRSSGWYKASTETPVEIGQYCIHYFSKIGCYIKTGYNVHYDWYEQHSNNDAKLAHYVKVWKRNSRSISFLNDSDSNPPQPDSNSNSNFIPDPDNLYEYVSIYDADWDYLVEAKDLGGVWLIDQLYWYDDIAEEYKKPNYFAYLITTNKYNANELITYSVLELGVDGFELAKKDYNGIVTLSGNDIDGAAISKLDGSSANKTTALPAAHNCYLGCLLIPTSEVYESVTVSIEKTDTIPSTIFSMSDALNDCDPANINYFKMLESLRTSVTVTSHKPYVIYVVAYDSTKYDYGYPTFNVTYNLKLKETKSESYVLPDKLWLSAKAGNALMAYDSEYGLRLIFGQKVVNFNADGISTQKYVSNLILENSLYYSDYSRNYLKIMKIQTKLGSTLESILKW